jgi:hypothetical protein
MKFRRRIILSIAIGFILVLADYLIVNTGYPLFDDLDQLALIGYFTNSNKTIPYDDADVILINIGYDKSLAYVVEDGDTLGTIDVTDRRALLHLMTVAKDARYRYMFVDVRFPAELHTDIDDSLYEVMSRMPNFAISRHKNEQLSDPRLAKVAAYSDYGVTITTGFSRYEMLQDKGPSVALKMYQDLNGHNITRQGPIYLDGSRLCFNNIFVPVPSGMVTDFNNDNVEQYMRLGWQMFRYDSDDQIRQMLKDKYVIVGDFDNDIHTTYAGDIPGAMLSLLAYYQVKNGHHHIQIFAEVLILLLFISIIYIMLSDEPIIKISDKSNFVRYRQYINRLNRIGHCKAKWLRFPARCIAIAHFKTTNVAIWAYHNSLMRFIISFITWDLLLSTLKVIYYITFNILITTIIPSLCFTIIGQLMSNANRKS